MITLVMGEEVKPPSPSLWFAYDNKDHPGHTTLQCPEYEPLAALAQRLRFPTADINRLWVPNLDTLRHGTPPRRNPQQVDFNTAPELMRLSRMVTEGKYPHTSVVFSSFDRLYDILMVRVGRGLADEREAVLAYGRALISEALCQLVSDFSKTQDVYLQYSNLFIPSSIHALADKVITNAV